MQVENARNHACSSLVEIAVGEHDIGRFSAELECDTLHRLRCLCVDARTRGVRTRERDFRDVGMIDQRCADFLAVTGDDVEDAIRKPGFFQQLGVFQGGYRRKFGGLDHYGAAGRKRGCAFPGNKEQGGVPRRQRPDHTDGLVARPGHHVRFVDGHHRALDLVGQATEIAPPLAMVVKLSAHFGHQLAVVAHLDLGKAIGVLGHELGQPNHQLAALGRQHRGPRAFAQGLRGRRDRAIDVLRATLRDPRPRLSLVGVDAVDPPLLRGFNPLTTDVMVVCLHVGFPFPSRLWVPCHPRGRHDRTLFMESAIEQYILLES